MITGMGVVERREGNFPSAPGIGLILIRTKVSSNGGTSLIESREVESRHLSAPPSSQGPNVATSRNSLPSRSSLYVMDIDRWRRRVRRDEYAPGGPSDSLTAQIDLSTSELLTFRRNDFVSLQLIGLH
ncbi:hypothetical protein FRC02_008554 [Tulasnella sp. 418]|nr:hypothetical protein FRC02_008554 [Tulasnella sp. 418]